MKLSLCITLSLLLLAGCTPTPDAALGTLERDRIALPATVAERIATIAVREGASVQAGDVLLSLESERTRARLDAANAEVARLQAVLDEARAGPRSERIDSARQQLARAESAALNAAQERERIDAVVTRGLLPQAERDRARNASRGADAEVRAARAALDELLHGTRSETIAQAEAALAAARANVKAIDIDVERTQVRAPRAGTVDSLPFEVGDQVAVGTPLAILLVGDRPYARVYVPQPLRLGVKIGTPATIHLHGDATAYAGTVRAIRSEASFTPYFALTGEDAGQLSYLAEVELGDDAAALPIGMPLRVEFGQGSGQ
jgi:HlyD family secretion protein